MNDLLARLVPKEPITRVGHAALGGWLADFTLRRRRDRTERGVMEQGSSAAALEAEIKSRIAALDGMEKTITVLRRQVEDMQEDLAQERKQRRELEQEIDTLRATLRRHGIAVEFDKAPVPALPAPDTKPA